MSKKTILSKKISSILFLSALLSGVASFSYAHAANNNLNAEEQNYITNGKPSESPMSIGDLNVSPLVMLVMGREHNIFSEAYPDYTDIDGDGKLDIMYDPSIAYEGLFESDLCYEYESSPNLDNKNNTEKHKPQGIWVPKSNAETKTRALAIWNNKARTVNYCPNSDQWLGNFMNYATTSRLDALKRVLYGGTRLYDTTFPGRTSKPTRYQEGDKIKSTILKHTHVLRDAHAWGKVLGDDMYNGQFTVSDFTGLQATGVGSNKAWFFAIASTDNSRGSSYYFRYGLVSNAGMPGVTSNSAQNYIWHWVSRQSINETNKTAIGSEYITKKNNSNESLFDNGTFQSRDVLIATCTKDFHSGNHCRAYGDAPNVNYQPYGVLQQYGEGSEPNMLFGLISGSWKSNTKSSALRGNLGILAKEINVRGDNTADYLPGDFDFRQTCDNSKCHGIINTLDRFAIQQKDDGTSGTYTNCARTPDSLPNVGNIDSFKCNDWGNPLAKLLYGAAMYYKGDYSGVTGTEAYLNIDNDTYIPPYYTTSSNNYNSSIKYCAKPNTLLIADENVSFDSTTYVGDTTPFGSNTSAITNEVKAISGETGAEFTPNQKYFTGRVVKANTDLDYYDYLPTLKEVGDLSQIVGIAPTAAYSFGSYNMAGVASIYNKKLITAQDPNNPDNNEVHVMKTYVVAMKPNMPEINIRIDDTRTVTLLPFAKTPENNYGDMYSKVMKNSTNQVVDFYVEKLTDTEGIFRINYEDFQYGSDYDMDAVIGYKYEVITGTSGTKYIRVQLSNVEADGYAAQSAGYVIAGVDHEGAYIDLAKTNSNVHNRKLDIDNIVNDYFLMGKCYPASYYDAFDRCGKYGKGTINEASYKQELETSNIDAYYSVISDPNSIYGSMYYLPRYEISKLLQNKGDWGTKTKADDYYLLGTNDRNDRYNVVSSRVFKVADTTSNVWLHSPLWLAAKFGLDEKQRAKVGDPSNYFLASNPAMLRTGISKMLEQINTSSHSGSSFSTQKKATSSDDYAYATLYDPSVWWGDVRNAKIDDAVGKNEGGYNYDSFDDAWSLKDAFEKVDSANINNNKAPDIRNIVTADIKTGKIHRLYAGEQAAQSKATSDSSTYAFRYITQDIADAIIGTYDHENPNHRLYLNRLVRWLAGDHTYEYNGQYSGTALQDMNLEENHNKPLRERSVTKENSAAEKFTLGDIINSDVKVFSDDLPGKNDGNRILVVGANDGMLHFAKITVNASGEEGEITPILSYVPTPALSRLKEIADNDYGKKTHISLVDSTPQVYKDSNNVIVYGTYGLGLKGAYAFNVHELGSKITPKMGSSDLKAALDNMNFLQWELTDSASYAGMMREPPIVAYTTDSATNSKHPYLIFSSGYKAQKAGIFVVDLLANNSVNNSACLADGIYADGTKPKKSPCIVSQIPMKELTGATKDDLSDIDPWGLGRENVPTRVTLVDVNGNESYQAFYWADNFGWVWKASLDHKDILNKPACWGGLANCTITIDEDKRELNNNFVPLKIFAAVDSNGVAQPITVKPSVGYHKHGGIGLVIGTGSYFEDYDGKEVSLKYNTAQSVYMIRDLSDNIGVNASNPSVTIKRCITDPKDGEKCLQHLKAEATQDKEGKYTRSIKPNDEINDADPSWGWYFDLTQTPINGKLMDNAGERVYRNIIVSGDTVYVITNRPDVKDTCNGGGTSYVISGPLFSGRFEQQEAFEALAGEPVLNVYTDAEGNIKTILQVPLDDKTSKLSGVKSVPIETSDPTVKSSSWLRLY